MERVFSLIANRPGFGDSEDATSAFHNFPGSSSLVVDYRHVRSNLSRWRVSQGLL